MQAAELFASVFVVGMFAGVFIVYMGLRQRSQQLEMHHRERMAMIERGQIPLSEPTGAGMRRLHGGIAPSSRSLSVGIVVVGLGLALMTIISIAGESPEVGIGVGVEPALFRHPAGEFAGLMETSDHVASAVRGVRRCRAAGCGDAGGARPSPRR